MLGREVRFYLVPGILSFYDSLHFDGDSWAVLRDCGVFPGEYRVRVRLLRVEVRNRESGGTVEVMELYPYRDVVVPEVLAHGAAAW